MRPFPDRSIQHEISREAARHFRNVPNCAFYRNYAITEWRNLSTLRTSGANRNPKLWNSEFVQIPIWNLDRQRRIVSDKIGQPFNSDMPLKVLRLPMSFPKFIGNVGRLSRIRTCLTDQSGTDKYEKNVDNIVAKCITGINFCFTLATIICKFGQFLDRIMFRTVLDGQLTPTLDIGQTLDRHFLKPAPLLRTIPRDAGGTQNIIHNNTLILLYTFMQPKEFGSSGHDIRIIFNTFDFFFVNLLEYSEIKLKFV